MNIVFDILKNYSGQLSAIAAAVAFIIGIWKYLSERRDNHFWKEFTVFHELVKELVEPTDSQKPKYLDRQAAIIFELRNFRRYYPYSLRMLRGLRLEWASKPNQSRLIEEIDLTIKFLERKCT